jgi:hypothetical protein
MYDLSTQISRTPRPQSCRQKNKERAGCDHKPGKHDGLGAVGRKRRRNQVPQRRDGADVIELRKRKSHHINAADNPEPPFELKPRRAHLGSNSARTPYPIPVSWDKSRRLLIHTSEAGSARDWMAVSLSHPVKERADGRKLRYSVVGAGWIAQEDFMPGVEKTGNSVMIALATGDAKKGRELSKKYDIAHVCGYGGFDALLKSGKIDAIYLATPNTMHRDFTVRALEAGIHVLCEKPMAPTIEDCRAMIDAGKKSGAKLMIAYRLHFEEATLVAIETVRSGKLGKPHIFRASSLRTSMPRIIASKLTNGPDRSLTWDRIRLTAYAIFLGRSRSKVSDGRRARRVTRVLAKCRRW